MLAQAEFQLASSGYQSAALPVELSSPQGLEASLFMYLWGWFWNSIVFPTGYKIYSFLDDDTIIADTNG